MDLDQPPSHAAAGRPRLAGGLRSICGRFSTLAALLISGFWAPDCGAGELDQFYPAGFAPGQADSAGAVVVGLEAGESIENVDIVLEPRAGTLTGSLHGAGLEAPVPLSDVVVEARAGSWLARTRTRPDGVFTFAALPGRSVRLHYATDDATSSGRIYAAADAGPYEVSEGQTLDIGAVTLAAGSVLEGSVLLEEDGMPAAQIRVEAVSEGGVILVAHPSDPAGRFALGGLVPGRFTVRVVPAEGSPYLPEVLGGARDVAAADFVDLEAGESREVGSIGLDRGGEIGGRVSNTGLGRPIADAVVELRPRGDGESRFTTTDEFGFYTFVGVPAGTYIVYVPILHRYFPDEPREEDARDLVLAEGEVRFRIDLSGSTQEGCTLPPSSQGVITGFADMDFSLLTSAMIRATSDSDTLELVLENAGFYTLECVPPGVYRVGLFTDGPFLPQYHRKVQDPERATLVTIAADTTAAVDFEPAKGITVRGRVIGDGGAGVPGARVALLGDGLLEIASTLSDGEGGYEISLRQDRSGVPAGRYYVRADSTFVPGPDVTPIRQPYIEVVPRAGRVELTLGLPEGVQEAFVERGDDPAVFSRPEGGLRVFERVFPSSVPASAIPFEDAPPGSGGWWYRLTVRGDFGTIAVMTGPVFLTAAPLPLRSVSIGPNPWSGSGSVRIFLGAPPSAVGVLTLFDVRGRRVTDIPWTGPTSSGSARTADSPAPGSVSRGIPGAFEWTPRDRAGRPLVSGVYYLRWLDGSGRERAEARWVVLR